MGPIKNKTAQIQDLKVMQKMKRRLEGSDTLVPDLVDCREHMHAVHDAAKLRRLKFFSFVVRPRNGAMAFAPQSPIPLSRKPY